MPSGSRRYPRFSYTIKMTAAALGNKLISRGRVLQSGRTLSVGAADIIAVSDGGEVLCGTVLATSRNFKPYD